MISAALIAMSLASVSTAPTPTPVIVGIKSEGHREIVRLAFLGFDVDHVPRAPEDMEVTLHFLGWTSRVTLHRNWQGLGGVRGGWIPADYVLDIPRGATGEAVLSLNGAKDGWNFRFGE